MMCVTFWSSILYVALFDAKTQRRKDAENRKGMSIVTGENFDMSFGWRKLFGSPLADDVIIAMGKRSAARG